MSLGERRNKDQAMAARMKQEGVERKVANCPICHFTISLEGLFAHLTTCQGRGRGRAR